MSLDVYLEVEEPVKKERGSGIFIRKGGQMIEVSREEWDRRNPGCDPVVFLGPDEEETNCVYRANITHNLGSMATEAGLYGLLWRPEEMEINKAAQLIGPIESGLAKLKSDPDHFKQYNPPNGWGNYDLLVRFTDEYLAACRAHPDANVRVWR
jgi:hypothetical protein